MNDFYKLSSIDYLNRWCPTRLTWWPGNGKVPPPDNAQLQPRHIPISRTKQLRMTLTSGEVLTFNSYASAADYIGVSSSTISRVVTSKKPYPHYGLLLLEEYNESDST